MYNKKIIQFLGTILFVVTVLSNVHPQSGFVFRYSTPEDKYPNDIVETSDGGYIISVSVGTYPLDYQTLLFRLDKYGDTIKTMKIMVPQGTCVINDIVKLDNGNFIGLGLKKHNNNNAAHLWLLTLSDSLTIVNDTSFSTNFSDCWNLLGIIDHFHDIIIYGDAIPYGTPPNPYPFVFKISQNCDSLFSRYYTNPWGQIVYSMMEKQDSTGYLMSISGSMNPPSYSPSQFLTMDYGFNITRMDSIPGSLELYMNTGILNAKMFLVTGLRHFEFSNPRTDKIGILKIDTIFQISDEFFFGPDDTVTYPAYNTNLSFLNPENIFLGGVANQDWGNIFSYNLSYIMLGKFDSALNLTWQKYFGGDMYYMVWSVIATTDGGCIIGASSNDYATQGEQRDIYILKVDSNGILTGINNPPPVQNQESVVYPNPGNDIIYIETKNENSTFNLYDLTGRLTYNMTLLPGKNQIPVQNLKQGLYIYKIIGNSEVKGYGKWIKN